MKAILADVIYTDKKLLFNHGIIFDKQIITIASHSDIIAKAKDKNITISNANIVIPGLINPHVHLEFSSNQTSLEYGNFISWLYSVIKNRDELISRCDDEMITQTLQQMAKNGITTIGAVSSYGFDLNSCASSKQNIIYFNELLGSDMAMADVLYDNFLSRFNDSSDVKREGFYPAIAIHSPYSTNRVIIKKAIELAKSSKAHLSAHLLESHAEREWLDSGSGDFAPFFKDFLNQSTPANSASDFISYFDDTPTLFTHATQIDDSELEKLSKHHHTIIHCPISNRLLGNSKLNLKSLKKHSVAYICATDGLSSHYNLDIFEELKIALFSHSDEDLLELALELFDSVTARSASALGLNIGSIKEGFNADIVAIDVDYPLNEQLPIHLLLQPKTIKDVYIKGESIL